VGPEDVTVSLADIGGLQSIIQRLVRANIPHQGPCSVSGYTPKHSTPCALLREAWTNDQRLARRVVPIADSMICFTVRRCCPTATAPGSVQEQLTEAPARSSAVWKAWEWEDHAGKGEAVYHSAQHLASRPCNALVQYRRESGCRLWRRKAGRHSLMSRPVPCSPNGMLPLHHR